MFNGMKWFNEPAFSSVDEGSLQVVTKENTDFWQRTHYGFQRNDGHLFYKDVTGDFVMQATCEYKGECLYDQCGIMIMVDSDNWVKASCEYENDTFSHLGAVVTSLGYSDWSTQEINTAQKSITYKMERKGNTVTVSASIDGGKFMQMRIAHLHTQPATLKAGVYACTPQRAGLRCSFTNFAISPL